MPSKKNKNLTEQRLNTTNRFGPHDVDERTEEVLYGLISEKVDFAKMWASQCESPIEKLLFIVLVWDYQDITQQFGLQHILLRPQQPVTAEGKNFRVDILLTAEKGIGAVKEIVIECDGHDYHERTKEQAAHDRERDRILTRAGYTVLRYTGSEIYRDPIRCAKDVWNTLETLL